jgi:hypothetical protein
VSLRKNIVGVWLLDIGRLRIDFVPQRHWSVGLSFGRLLLGPTVPYPVLRLELGRWYIVFKVAP